MDEMLDRLTADELLRWMAWTKTSDEARAKADRDAEAKARHR